MCVCVVASKIVRFNTTGLFLMGYMDSLAKPEMIDALEDTLGWNLFEPAAAVSCSK